MTEGRFVKVKVLLRITLLFFVVYAMSGHFFSPSLAGARIEKTPETMNGMGGGMPYPESSLAGMALDAGLPEPEGISGIPEPDEYSKPRMLLYNAYTVREGDTIGDIARNLGLNQDTLISLNNIKNTRLLQIGQVLRVPNQDGIFYT
ncbi:MAG: LysM peptidoglycan-binding domain-containing protein, partial [Treponema sp.]|nr:LysM peptidoglycan-binding domain-containing protein [Treponema sp.]